VKIPKAASRKAKEVRMNENRRAETALVRCPRLSVFSTVLASLLALGAPAQNVIEDLASGQAAPPIQLTASDLSALLKLTPSPKATLESKEARRVAAKLDAHVAEFLAGWPWMAFHHTLGISGYEAYFNHPDEMFSSLALALPWLEPATAEKTKAFLASQLAQCPPYALEGYDNTVGKPRESYDVPPALRLRGRGRARSVFGVYAFWSYCRSTGNTDAAKAHWDAVKGRMKPLLEGAYAFDIRRRDYSKDEAERLTGDLAGLIGFLELAQLNGDGEAEKAARARAVELLNLRINLERVNPVILERTSASKSLHVSKLARFCGLTPEIGAALSRQTDGCAAAHLKDFREARNGWYLAFGDRLIGGENYTNPLHFGRALFAGAALVEQLPREQLLRFVDVPHGRGDFYFIERCALALAAPAP
jgi:hypothetical protein